MYWKQHEVSQICIKLQKYSWEFWKIHCNGSVPGRAICRSGSLVYKLPSQAAAWETLTCRLNPKKACITVNFETKKLPRKTFRWNLSWKIRTFLFPSGNSAWVSMALSTPNKWQNIYRAIKNLKTSVSSSRKRNFTMVQCYKMALAEKSDGLHWLLDPDTLAMLVHKDALKLNI